MMTSVIMIMVTSFVASQNTYKDTTGRFSFQLPVGWKLHSEKLNTEYHFVNPEGSCTLILTYGGLLQSLDYILISFLREVLKLEGGILPPKESIVDMTLNGAAARWIEYPVTFKTNGGNTIIKHVLLGGATDSYRIIYNAQ